MSYRIFLAGATGVIGRRLAVLLRDAGHRVTGTRDAAKAESMRAIGVEPVVVDVFDAAALMRGGGAALLAVDRGARGIYNIAEPNPHVDIATARNALGWDVPP
jgi:nucleoside-diphosphate-sugar epimerase